MVLDFSQIEQNLATENQSSLPRQMLIFAGTKQWQLESLNRLISNHINETLWVGSEAPDKITSCLANKAHQWLGGEKKLVVFDANDFQAEPLEQSKPSKNSTSYFDADAFAAISGIVVGGGFLILLMPEQEQWLQLYPSLFGQRLIKSIQANSEIIIVSESDNEIKLSSHAAVSNNKKNCEAPFLTQDQQYAVQEMQKMVLAEKPEPVVLVSDRGRGKSAALGITAARLIKAGLDKIIITAPRLRASDIVFKHAAEELSNAYVSRGQIQYNHSKISFYPPDLLLQVDIEADVLFIDEAAAIPIPLLIALLKKYPLCIFSTTVHGYEGTGRGFALRFNKVLDIEKPAWKKLHMKTPIRWAENDQLEQWMFSLLCLDAELVETNLIADFYLDKLELKVLNKNDLTDNEILLKEVFSLLVLAHYKTQPSDLQRLLDSDDITLYVALFKQHVIAVTLVNHEGLFSDELSEAVYQGVRRPKGHLLAQTLTYHCGISHAATLNYARIMRIAVHPEFQQRGIGSRLLDFIVKNETVNSCDAVGASFGLNEKLLSFWELNKFDVVRIGLTREQTSGEHAAILLKGLSNRGLDVYKQAQLRFINQFSFLVNDVLRDLSEPLINSFQLNTDDAKQINNMDKEDLYSYINYSRNYELCISVINKLILNEQDTISEEGFPENFRLILNEKITKRTVWKDIALNMNLSGKNSARNYFKEAIIHLLESSSEKYLD